MSKISVLFPSLVGALMVSLLPVQANAQTTSRPLQDWLTAQGGGYFWWTEPGSPNNFYIDYVNNYGAPLGLGTTLSGTVTERKLRNGQTQVSVKLHVQNAFGYAWRNDTGLALGHSYADVVGGKDPAVGDCLFSLDYVTSRKPGDPMTAAQDRHTWLPASRIVKIQIVAELDGTLRASFGVPDGTPGKAQTTQVGLYGVSAWNSGSDYFPAEHINIFPTGPSK